MKILNSCFSAFTVDLIQHLIISFGKEHKQSMMPFDRNPHSRLTKVNPFRKLNTTRNIKIQNSDLLNPSPTPHQPPFSGGHHSFLDEEGLQLPVLTGNTQGTHQRDWSAQDEILLCERFNKEGPRWVSIREIFPTRTADQIKSKFSALLGKTFSYCLQQDVFFTKQRIRKVARLFVEEEETSDAAKMAPFRSQVSRVMKKILTKAWQQNHYELAEDKNTLKVIAVQAQKMCRKKTFLSEAKTSFTQAPYSEPSGEQGYQSDRESNQPPRKENSIKNPLQEEEVQQQLNGDDVLKETQLGEGTADRPIRNIQMVEGYERIKDVLNTAGLIKYEQQNSGAEASLSDSASYLSEDIYIFDNSIFKQGSTQSSAWQ